MRITNQYNLPDAVYNVIAKDNYVRGDNNYSVTELLEAPRVVQLKRRFWDELKEDAIDRIWSIFGSAVHHLMETHASDDTFVEQRYYIQRCGRTIGGMVDAYNNGVITDYKVTSAYSVLFGSKTDSWTKQLNMYAHILRENGLEVNRLFIAAFLRDWDRNRAKQDPKYPKTPFLMIPITLWSHDECEAFVEERLSLHIANEECATNMLVRCTPEEMWQRPSVYAVMKDGRKSAVRLFDTTDEAYSFMHMQKDVDKHQVNERRGGCTRCESYCVAKDVCSQYQEYLLN